MARHPTLSDSDILCLAHPVFLHRGLDARTRDISAAVGLTWGAIALRFGSKRALFEQAMRHAASPAEDANADSADPTDLPEFLRQLAWRWSQQWPVQLQWHMASTAAQQRLNLADELQQSLALVLKQQADRGKVRRDLPAQDLAAMVVSVLTGHAADLFVNGHHNASSLHELLHTLLRLLTAAPPPLSRTL